METFNIEEIKEEIKHLSIEEQIDYLNNLETELQATIDELETNLAEISDERNEMEDAYQSKQRDSLLLALKDASYDMQLDENRRLPIPFGDATVFIQLGYLTTDIDFTVKANANDLTHCAQIAALLPDYRQSGNFFHKSTTPEALTAEIVSLVKRLKEAKM